jgi:hypothetical protein
MSIQNSSQQHQEMRAVMQQQEPLPINLDVKHNGGGGGGAANGCGHVASNFASFTVGGTAAAQVLATRLRHDSEAAANRTQQQQQQQPVAGSSSMFMPDFSNA